MQATHGHLVCSLEMIITSSNRKLTMHSRNQANFLTSYFAYWLMFLLFHFLPFAPGYIF